MLTDRFIGAAICVSASALALYAWRSYPWDAAFFPVVVLMLMVIGGGVMVYTASISSVDAAKGMVAERFGVGGTAARIILILLACTAAIPWLGFYTTCFIGMIIIPIIASGHIPTRIELTKDLLYAIITMVSVYVVFGIWLNLQAPQGILI